MRKWIIKKHGKWVARTPGREINDLTDDIYKAHTFDDEEDCRLHVIKANSSKGADGKLISNGWPEGVEVVGITIIYMEDID